jgi:hypothetical protein
VELRNEFRVAVPPATAWLLLNDVERIAPCLPGAQLQEIEGDEYRGLVKVKVGPISAQYKGQATFVQQDEPAGRMVLKATGRDTGGGGHANAVITVTLIPDGAATTVTVVTDLAITGRLAQFGKGVIEEVTTNLLNQFVACLQHQLLAPPAPAPPAEPAPTLAANGATDTHREEPRTAARMVAGPEVEPVDLLEAARPSLAKRAGPALAGLAVLIAAVLWWRRRP